MFADVPPIFYSKNPIVTSSSHKFIPYFFAKSKVKMQVIILVSEAISTAVRLFAATITLWLLRSVFRV